MGRLAVERVEIRRITSDIRRVLLNVWDPIGVKDEPNAQDEYDCCIGGVFQLLRNGSNEDQLADYLLERANEHMGLGMTKESMMPTAKALRQISLHTQ